MQGLASAALLNLGVLNNMIAMILVVNISKITEVLHSKFGIPGLSGKRVAL